jgi:hypothetical protein
LPNGRAAASSNNQNLASLGQWERAPNEQNFQHGLRVHKIPFRVFSSEAKRKQQLHCVGNNQDGGEERRGAEEGYDEIEHGEFLPQLHDFGQIPRKLKLLHTIRKS